MLRSHGRKSQHAAMVSGVADLNWPPPPPLNITERAQREWRDVTNNISSDAMPRESLPLLAVWCALKTELDDVMLDLMGDHDHKQRSRLVRTRTMLARELSQLSSKLRLTPSARLDAHRSQSGVSSNKPWSAKEQQGQQFEFSSKLEAQRSSNGNPWAKARGSHEPTVVRRQRARPVSQRPFQTRVRSPPPSRLETRFNAALAQLVNSSPPLIEIYGNVGDEFLVLADDDYEEA